MEVLSVSRDRYPELIEVWEASVRATHHFLSEEYINELKPLILERYLDAVELRQGSVAGQLVGFLGVADTTIEMLFVRPDFFGKGVGTMLVEYAIAHFGVTKVDVNEQNPDAIAFYKKMGFALSGRSELDGQGNPFPLVHMVRDGTSGL
ncbi:MAG: GNAT family N-acetyltransferase [Pseudomonadota bacterium]